MCLTKLLENANSHKEVTAHTTHTHHPPRHAHTAPSITSIYQGHAMARAPRLARRLYSRRGVWSAPGHVSTIVPRKCSGSFCFSRAAARASSTTGSTLGPVFWAFVTPASTSFKLCRSSFRSMTCRGREA
eukprot:scaffold40464_cov63-Phaeocystis_antarctica.AAC.4